MHAIVHNTPTLFRISAYFLTLPFPTNTLPTNPLPNQTPSQPNPIPTNTHPMSFASALNRVIKANAADAPAGAGSMAGPVRIDPRGLPRTPRGDVMPVVLYTLRECLTKYLHPRAAGPHDADLDRTLTYNPFVWVPFEPEGMPSMVKPMVKTSVHPPAPEPMLPMADAHTVREYRDRLLEPHPTLVDVSWKDVIIQAGVPQHLFRPEPRSPFFTPRTLLHPHHTQPFSHPQPYHSTTPHSHYHHPHHHARGRGDVGGVHPAGPVLRFRR